MNSEGKRDWNDHRKEGKPFPVRGEPAPPPDPEPEKGKAHGSKDTFSVICLEDVIPKEVRWLWNGRIPFGKLTGLVGDPEVGKSTFVADLISRFSTGQPMPGEGMAVPSGNSLLMTAEESLADTVRPRLEIAGADHSRVFAIEEMLTFPEDLPSIKNLIVEKAIGLVIIDPLTAYIAGSVDTHKDHDIRRLLSQLRELADQTGAAIVIVRHLTKMRKNQGVPAIYRAGGSIAFTAAERSELLIARDPKDQETRMLCRVKCNLAPPVPSLTFRLVSHGAVARIEWTGESSITADELLNQPTSKDNPKPRDEAKEFLLEALADGAQPTEDLLKEAKRRGISRTTLYRARDALKVGSKPKDGYQAGTDWFLPESANTTI
jgi:hypothetical protein